MRASSRGWQRKSGWRVYSKLLLSRRFRKRLLTVLGGALAIYVLISAYYFRDASFYYADVVLGDTRQGVRYGVGAPIAARDAAGQPAAPDNAATWHYTTATGGAVTVAFADGVVSRVTCEQADAVRQACPSHYRIALGTDEGTLTRKLGQPDRARLREDRKIMFYDGIGVEYGLKRYQVYSITATKDRSSGFRQFTQFLRSLVP